MYGDPALWFALLDRLADLAIASLRVQVAAGASAVQLFDSWAGALSPADYERYVLPASAQGARRRSPTSACRASTSASAPASCSALMADGRRRRRRASTGGCRSTTPARRVPADVALQGNLDPARRARARGRSSADGARDVLRRNAGHPGHIFNLGHGVLPETDPDVLEQVVELVHAEGARRPRR